MKKLFRFLGVLIGYFIYEDEDDCDIAVRKASGIIIHVEVPDSVLSIHHWHGLYYETSRKIALPNNCLETFDKLVKLREWKGGAIRYFTTHDWVSILHSQEPVIDFIQRVKHIEKQFKSIT